MRQTLPILASARGLLKVTNFQKTLKTQVASRQISLLKSDRSIKMRVNIKMQKELILYKKTKKKRKIKF